MGRLALRLAACRAGRVGRGGGRKPLPACGRSESAMGRNAAREWCGAGLLLAVAGTALVVSEIQHGIEAGNPLSVAYGGAVVLATVIAVLLILPGMRSHS